MVLLSNQKCMIQPTLINLHPNEHNQEFHYYPFAVKLDRCVGSYNILDSKSNRRFISKHAQHEYRNNLIKNINNTYIMQM